MEYRIGHKGVIYLILFTFCSMIIFYNEVGELCTGFWWGNLRERDYWGDSDVDERIILRWIFRKWKGIVWTGWSWFRIGRGGGRL